MRHLSGATLPLCVLWVLVGFAAVRLIAYSGLFSTHRIAGGSMADTYLGAHYRLACPLCRFPIQFNATVSRPSLVVCPNCGHRTHEVEAAEPFDGDRVLLERLPPWREVGRWDPIAFASQGSPLGREVKRVLGLPGEHVAIEQGDLFINGQRRQKSLAELRQVALLVHDDRFRPARRAGRWAARDDAGFWQVETDGYRFNTPPPDAPLQWLDYTHRSVEAAEPYPPPDSYGFNQHLRRPLFPVRDVMLSGRLSVTGRGRFVLALTDGHEVFTVELLPDARQARLLRNGDLVARRRLPLPPGRTMRWFELARCDDQLLFALDDMLVFREPLDSPPRAPRTSQPLRLGAQAVEARVADLLVRRDVYYLDPAGLNRPWQAAAAVEQGRVFVAGDNVPISVDSRHDPERSPGRAQVLGRVLRYEPEAPRDHRRPIRSAAGAGR